MSVEDEILFINNRLLQCCLDFMVYDLGSLHIRLSYKQRQWDALAFDYSRYGHSNVNILEGDKLPPFPAHCMCVSVPCHAIPNVLIIQAVKEIS